MVLVGITSVTRLLKDWVLFVEAIVESLVSQIDACSLGTGPTIFREKCQITGYPGFGMVNAAVIVVSATEFSALLLHFTPCSGEFVPKVIGILHVVQIQRLNFCSSSFATSERVPFQKNRNPYHVNHGVLFLVACVELFHFRCLVFKNGSMA